MDARAWFSAPATLVLAWLLVAVPVVCAAGALARDGEPVVLHASDLPGLTGRAPSSLVAFRYEDAWVQIPIQVDERAVVDFGDIYNWGPAGYIVLTYTDTATFTGPDPDPLLDADDEVVFLAGGAGEDAAGCPEPEHVLPGSGVEIELTHPVTSERAFVYVFESDGALDPAAGASDIDYQFDLLSGPYKTTYDTNAGPNPEDSRVTTSAYSVRFSDRWIRDETSMAVGGATGADILDRHKNLFAPGNCTRSEDTFSAGEGAFIVNRTGPVRALRGYVGANSGPTTHRIHAFYDAREVVLTVLRVHAISGVMDYFDYSPAAASMTYLNEFNPGGVTIDGVQDTVVPGAPAWEMVTGPQGTLAMALRLFTDIPGFSYTSYYSDHLSPPETQCTGDDYEYGASGLWVDQAIPNTDPGVSVSDCYVFEMTRHVAYGAPALGAAFAEALAEEVDGPLLVSSTSYVATGVSGADPGGDDTRGPALARAAFSPNPFGESTSVRLVLREPGRVTIDLFDVSGRLVGRPFDDVLPAGTHDTSISMHGNAAGVYFARATGPDGLVMTSRIVVLR